MIELNEADELVQDNLYEDDPDLGLWNRLSPDEKIKVIRDGAREIEKFVYLGRRETPYQESSWPRRIAGETYEMPEEIKLGSILIALRKKNASSREETKLQNLGVKSYSIKGASISFSDSGKSGSIPAAYKEVYDTYFSKWTY